MSDDILSLLQERFRTFSKGQKLIANYIMDSYDKAAFMTASRLGKTVGVSESTVVRFAVELGFDGYPSMQKTLQALVRTKLTSVQRIEVSNSRIAGDVAGAVLQADIDALRRTGELLDREQLEKCVDAILHARRIYIVGVRSSAAIAFFLNFHLRSAFDNVQLITSASTSEMFEQMIHVTHEDIVLGISLPRYSVRTVKLLQYARARGATTASITDKVDAPAGRVSDCVLVAKSDMVSVVDSLVAPMSVVNALLALISRRQEQMLSRTYQDIERLWEEYDVNEYVE
ncbi:MAG: MurR/RpiR family transcriptional regulator [Clostridiales bacterium]|nr:MurR/RpiR family transcriptional regulator [Clostridiales bacterium]